MPTSNSLWTKWPIAGLRTLLNKVTDAFKAQSKSPRSDIEPDVIYPPEPSFATTEPYVLGFDISHHQVYVEFAAMVTQGYRFCFLKATEGNSFKDPMFATHVACALEVGLLVGAYHFARVRREDSYTFEEQGVRQARFFVQVVKKAFPKGAAALPLVLDIEWHDSLKEGKIKPSELIRFIDAFNDIVVRSGFNKVIIYTGPSFFMQYLKKPLDYRLWLVSGYNKKFRPTKKIPDWEPTFYQFTNTQPVPYSNKRKLMKIDANVFYGSEEDLKQLLCVVTN
jgi:lysozyme